MSNQSIYQEIDPDEAMSPKEYNLQNEHDRDEEYIGHLAAIVESSEDAIISKSLEGIIKSWNKGGEKMFGYKAAEVIGKNISLIIPPEGLGEEKIILARLRNNETLKHYETIRCKKNGKKIYVSLTVSPLKNRAGTIIGISKIARDITAKKRSEAKLININKRLVAQNSVMEVRAAQALIANQELLLQNEEKERRAAELMIANKELEQLTYIASHDLQEPLRTICNYMQVFEEDYLQILDNDARNYIRAVNNAAKRMSILVKALLDFSRLGHDKQLAFVDCNMIISNVIADLQTLIRKTKATIEVGKMPELNIYEIEISQLFQNLITNAIKFQKRGTRPRITIDAKMVNAKWQFSIGDNGIGIEAAHFNRIFDIFQRLHLNDEYKGSGIGLANCKKIVELHQGKIWCESTPGVGTVFNFTIGNLSQ